MDRLLRLCRDERGQDLVEYTLLLAFVALASGTIFAGAGGSITGIWGMGSNSLSNAVTMAS